MVEYRKFTAGLAALSILALSTFSSAYKSYAAEIYSPKSVVELFTSQGCHSCPPADDFLATIANDKNYLALAFHVDYWDRLGWKDTFASQEFTQRQWNYAHAMMERSVYTPQAVINGRDHAVGSKGPLIVATAKDFAKTDKGLTVPITVIEKDGKIVVSIKAESNKDDATLYAVYFEPTATVKIERGELAGKTLRYSNIVRKVEMLGMTGANGIQTEFSISDLKAKGFPGCALILQQKDEGNNPGAIIGASVITDL